MIALCRLKQAFSRIKCLILSCPHVCSALLGKTSTSSSIIETNRHQHQHQKPPSSPTIQNTQTHLTHTSKSLMHTPNCSPPTRKYAKTPVIKMQTKNRRAVTDVFDGPSCVDRWTCAKAATLWQDDLVSVPVPGVSSASESTTQT